MKLYSLLVCFLINSFSTIVAQVTIDYFNPSLLQISRSVWDDQIDEGVESLIKNGLSSKDVDEISWSWLAIGVHLEKINFVDIPQSNIHDSLLITSFKDAKYSHNIDTFLINLLRKRNQLYKHSDEIPGNKDYIKEIELIRIVKATRKESAVEKTNFLAGQIGFELNSQQKLFLELASRNEKDIMSIFISYNDINKPVLYNPVEFSWVFITYRDKFIDNLKYYYSVENFNSLGITAKRILFHYWTFNLDLLNDNDKSKIKKLLNQIDPKETPFNLQVSQTLLQCLIDGCKKHEYMENINRLSNSKIDQRIIDDVRREAEIKNDQREIIENQTQKPQQKEQNIIIKPESKVQIFKNSSDSEIVNYIYINLKDTLYANKYFKQDSIVINLRKATELIGNAYIENTKMELNNDHINYIIKEIIKIGTRNDENCFEEASNLIFNLGRLAIPVLKQEFFSKNDVRAQFATQKLIALKNREVVTWLISVTKNSNDPDIKLRCSRMLLFMKDYWKPLMPNRGITKEESDALNKELIEPFLNKE